MAYHVYTTEGVVFSQDPQSEADAYYSIFTKDLGLIGAIGKGTRKKESKLASQLDQMTYGEFSFVHGKRGFRLIGAREVENIWKSFRHNTDKRKSFVAVARLLRMLLAGSEPNADLFAAFILATAFLKEETLSLDEIKAWEGIIMLRLLAILGYGDKETYESFLHTTLWSRFIISDAVPLLSRMHADIEEALLATDLAQTRSISEVVS